MTTKLINRMKEPTLWERCKKYRYLFLFLAPALIITFVFSYIPYVGVLLAFKLDPIYVSHGVLDGFNKATWTFHNFKIFLTDPRITSAIFNTLVISGLKTIILFPLSILIALQLSQIKRQWLAKTILIIICLPQFLSWAVTISMFMGLLDPTIGGVNNFIVMLGFNPILFFNEPRYFKPLVIFIAGWKGTGWNSIIFYASIIAIDKSFYEAAKIDGASRVKQMWYLTIPMIMGTIALMLVISITYLMDAGFEQIQIMLNGNTEESQSILGTYMYRLAFGGSNSLGEATAIGIFNGVIALFLMIGGNTIVKKLLGRSIW